MGFLKGTIIVIPTSQRHGLLKHLHACQCGLSKWLPRAKQTIYWPRLYVQIHQLVTKCQTCLMLSSNNHEQPTSQQLAWKVPLLLWRKVNTDIIQYEYCSYLTVVHYYSKFPVIWELDRIKARHVTRNMQVIISDYRWPDILISDNGPCYNVTEFKQVMEDMGAPPHKLCVLPSMQWTDRKKQLLMNLMSKVRRLVKIPIFPDVIQKHATWQCLAIPPWNYYVPGKLHLTYYCHMLPGNQQEPRTGYQQLVTNRKRHQQESCGIQRVTSIIQG